MLAGGLLTGKYRRGVMPSTARYTLYPSFMRRWSPTKLQPRGAAPARTLVAVDEYAAVAEAAGVSLAQLSLGFSEPDL